MKKAEAYFVCFEACVPVLSSPGGKAPVKAANVKGCYKKCDHDKWEEDTFAEFDRAADGFYECYNTCAGGEKGEAPSQGTPMVAPSDGGEKDTCRGDCSGWFDWEELAQGDFSGFKKATTSYWTCFHACTPIVSTGPLTTEPDTKGCLTKCNTKTWETDSEDTFLADAAEFYKCYRECNA